MTRFRCSSFLVVWLLALGLSSPMLGCTFILDFSAPIEQELPDAAFATVDAMSDASESLLCQKFEPNGLVTNASSIIAAPEEPAVEASICGNDDIDLYGFTLTIETSIHAQITFTPFDDAQGLDLFLLDQSANTILVSAGNNGIETIERRLLPGNYFLEVKADSSSLDIDYSLAFIIPAQP